MVDTNRFDRNIRQFSLLGLAAILLVIGGVGSWAYSYTLNGAIVTSGEIVVESALTQVQHREGGIVTKINVRDGDRVAQGDPLIELDTLELSGELTLVTQRLHEAMALRARLIAQRDDLDAIVFPDELMNEDGEQSREMFATQKRIFDAQKAVIDGRTSQLRQRMQQLNAEIEGLQSQQVANTEQFDIALDDKKDVEGLLQKGLVQKPRVLEVRNSVARLQGIDGQLTAQIARVRGQISEVKLQILQLREDLLSKSLDQLREAQSQISEMSDRRNSLREKILRTVISAPKSGIVHEMAVFNEGAVIGAGQKILEVVPIDDNLIVEAKVEPKDIHEVSVGQAADLVFENSNARITPKIEGRVDNVSAYVRQEDDRTGPIYVVRFSISEAELQKLDELQLRPGMQVTAFIQTQARTPLSFLMKPAEELWVRMFRG